MQNVDTPGEVSTPGKEGEGFSLSKFMNSMLGFTESSPSEKQTSVNSDHNSREASGFSKKNPFNRPNHSRFAVKSGGEDKKISSPSRRA